MFITKQGIRKHLGLGSKDFLDPHLTVISKVDFWLMIITGFILQNSKFCNHQHTVIM